MDSDSLLEREALIRIVRPFLEDASTIAVGGIIRIVNGCNIASGEVTDIRLPTKLLAQYQVLEYLRAFLAGRMGWDGIHATLIISGAFGVFRREAVVKAGGYVTDTVGEDMELVVRLHRYHLENEIPYNISFIPDPVAWTVCPESIRILAMPFFYFLEMLGPVVEFCGYITFVAAVIAGIASPVYVVAFLMVAFVFGIAISVASVLLEELTFRRYPRHRDLLHLFLLAVIENFGYRQLSTYLRIKGTLSALRKVKGWAKMERKGFSHANV